MTDISTNKSANAVMKADTPDDLKRLTYLIKLCWLSLEPPSRLLLLGVIGLVLVTSYGATLAPLLFARFIDALSLDIGFTAGAGVLIASFLIAYWLSYLGREVLWITAGPVQQRIQRRANAAFFAQAMALPFDEHLKTSIGGLNERLVQAQNGLNQIIFSALVDLLPTVVLTLFILLNSLLFLPGYVFVILQCHHHHLPHSTGGWG